MSFYNTPFHLLDTVMQAPLGSNVVVVSDTMYKEYRQKQAQKEIDILEARAQSYRETANLIEQEIATIQTEAGLLPATEEATAE